MALSDADLERARQAAAEAPPLTSERRERLRAILTGCRTAGSVPEPETAKGGAADAA